MLGIIGRTCGVVATMLGLAGAVLAHHGVTGQYDAATPTVLSGTLTASTFAPPLSMSAGRRKARGHG